MHLTFIHLIWRNPSSFSFIASNATVAVTRVYQENVVLLWSNICVCNVLYTDSKGGVKYAEGRRKHWEK